MGGGGARVAHARPVAHPRRVRHCAVVAAAAPSAPARGFGRAAGGGAPGAAAAPPPTAPPAGGSREASPPEARAAPRPELTHFPEAPPKRKSGKGKRGGGRAPEQPGDASRKKHIEDSRKLQISTTELMAELLQADDLVLAVREKVDEIGEDFFIVCEAYLTLAHREGNADVIPKLERLYTVAAAEKDATLRPELRLLNRLLRTKDKAEFNHLLETHAPTLEMEDRYFFAVIDRMLSDVSANTANPRRADTLQRLKVIQRDAEKVRRAYVKQQAG